MTVVRFTDGRSADVIDADCEFRPCFTYGLDRGPYVQGRGYTNPRGHVTRPVCNTRHLRGCPHRTDVFERACDGCGGPREPGVVPCPRCGAYKTYSRGVLLAPRPCCDAPRVRNAPGTYTQICQNCGTRLRGGRLEVARAASA